MAVHSNSSFAAFFDFGGTLADYASIAVAESEGMLHFAKDLGAERDAKALERAFLDALQAKYRESSSIEYRPSKLIIPEILRDLCPAYGLPWNAEALELFFRYRHMMHRKYVRLIKHVRELLQYLSDCGTELGLISDIDTDFLQGMIEELGIKRYFRIVVTSEDVNVCKPHPQIFQKAKERLCRTYCDDCIYYVGDSYEKDVVGAKGVGMKAILFDAPKSHAPFPMADHVVSDLLEIRSLLEMRAANAG